MEKVTRENYDHNNVSLNALLASDKDELAKLVFRLSIKISRIEHATGIEFPDESKCK